jgi:transcriptional regulator with XRE-family HTH domain
MSARGACDAAHSVSAGCPDPECYRYDSVDRAFSTALREMRERRGLTQAQLAAETNRMLSGSWAPGDQDVAPVTPQQVSDWEHARRPAPSVRRVRALADALGVSMDLLCGREHRRDGTRYPSSR